jgi:hypothetical protein
MKQAEADAETMYALLRSLPAAGGRETMYALLTPEDQQVATRMFQAEVERS